MFFWGDYFWGHPQIPFPKFRTHVAEAVFFSDKFSSERNVWNGEKITSFHGGILRSGGEKYRFLLQEKKIDANEEIFTDPKRCFFGSVSTPIVFVWWRNVSQNSTGTRPQIAYSPQIYKFCDDSHLEVRTEPLKAKALWGKRDHTLCQPKWGWINLRKQYEGWAICASYCPRNILQLFLSMSTPWQTKMNL